MKDETQEDKYFTHFEVVPSPINKDIYNISTTLEDGKKQNVGQISRGKWLEILQRCVKVKSETQEKTQNCASCDYGGAR